MKIKYIRAIIPVILLSLTMLLFSCKGTPETVIDIDGYREKTVELCESDLVGPGYVVLILDYDHSLCSVRIELPSMDENGTICGAADSEFVFKDGKVHTYPLYKSDHLEKRKHLDAIRILKGVYGEYLLYGDGTLEYVGGIAEEQLHRYDRMDTALFNIDILWDKYGIDFEKISNAAVTEAYEKQRNP